MSKPIAVLPNRKQAWDVVGIAKEEPGGGARGHIAVDLYGNRGDEVPLVASRTRSVSDAPLCGGGSDPANLGAEVQQTWATGALIQAAAKSGGSSSSADFINGLYKLHNATLGGLTTPLTYARGKAHPINCWFYLRVQNGKFTTPYGLKAVCHPPIQ